MSQCRKLWKRGPFDIFKHPFCCKIPKNWRGLFGVFNKKFSKKNKKMRNFNGSLIVTKIWNKTGTSKVGAISKAQKAQKIFLEKNWNFWKKIFFQKKSHSAEKCKRGTLLDLLTYIPLQNIKKLEGGTLWGQKKFRKKVAQCRKKLKGRTL